METRHLAEYVALVNEGSFTAAARFLGISQPALSKHVAALERDFGVDLVTREAGGVRPTEAGRIVYNLALCVESATARARGALSARASSAQPAPRPHRLHASLAKACAKAAGRFGFSDDERDALALYLESRNLNYVSVNLGVTRDRAAELMGSVYRKVGVCDGDALAGLVYSISE